jgi:hypothetical protein
VRILLLMMAAPATGGTGTAPGAAGRHAGLSEPLTGRIWRVCSTHRVDVDSGLRLEKAAVPPTGVELPRATARRRAPRPARSAPWRLIDYFTGVGTNS